MGLTKEKLVVFHSSHHSLKSEKIFTKNKIKYKMIALPPEISADCGTAISLRLELKKIIEIYHKNNILPKAVYELKDEQGYKEYKKVYESDK